nr:hypothetical protein CFP56_79609 [Quercus suber]
MKVWFARYRTVFGLPLRLATPQSGWLYYSARAYKTSTCNKAKGIRNTPAVFASTVLGLGLAECRVMLQVFAWLRQIAAGCH